MKKIELGNIEQVDVREIWEKEDTEFTPWLAEEENIQIVKDMIKRHKEGESLENIINNHIPK